MMDRVEDKREGEEDLPLSTVMFRARLAAHLQKI
jgi:hypothetical protein